MAQDITIAGATYPNVPGLSVPKSGGGTAYFPDTSTDTVTPSSLLRGATAHNAAGTAITGAYTAPYNVNLLHNADWGYSLVNQREHSGSVAAGAYCIDRWYNAGNSAGTVTPSAGSHITFASGTTLGQKMELISDVLLGRSVIFAYQDSSGNTYSNTLTFPSTVSGTAVTQTIGSLSVKIGFKSVSATLICGVSRTDVPYIEIGATEVVNVRRVWLELGSVLHMEITPPLDYAANLAICQRYYQKLINGTFDPIGFGAVDASSGNLAYGRVIIPLPVKMRVVPSMITNYDNTPSVFDYFQGTGENGQIAHTQTVGNQVIPGYEQPIDNPLGVSMKVHFVPIRPVDNPVGVPIGKAIALICRGGRVFEFSADL